MIVTDPFYESLIRRLNEIAPGVTENWPRVSLLAERDGREIAQVLLIHACASQHVGNIAIARELLLKLPLDWLSNQLPTAIGLSLNRDDEWQFRRLIEVLRIVAPELTGRYLADGKLSQNPDVKDAAEEFEIVLPT